MTVELNLLGNPRVTITVPQVRGIEHTSQKVMHEATKRYARQGAERVTLVPKRGGKGWEKSEE